MKATKILGYLIKNLKASGFIRYDKDFLDYVGVSNEIVSPKQLSGFIKRDGDIQNKLFLKEVEAFFKLPKNIWTSNEERQKNLIDDVVKDELILQSFPSTDALDVSTQIPTQLPCSKKQLKLLKFFSFIDNKQKLETMIDEFLSAGLLERKLENQEFLLALLKLAYDKGLYVIIIEFIVPNLYKKYYDKTEVQKCLAHTYGSLDEYGEAKQILAILLHHNTIENINLRTSALSNHKREILQINRSIQKEDLYVLIKGYQELHAIKGIYSYYTGINLLYMVVLGQILFSDDKRFIIDTQDIYNKSKPSLRDDKTHKNYYIAMSDLEFRMLLGSNGVLERVEGFLDNEEPHSSLVTRTVRQMELFTHNIREHNTPILHIFKKSITILQDYIKHSQ